MEEQIKKIAGEAFIEAHKAQSNALAISEVLDWFIRKHYPELEDEYIRRSMDARDNAMIEIISASEAMPQSAKDKALKKLNDSLKSRK